MINAIPLSVALTCSLSRVPAMVAFGIAALAKAAIINLLRSVTIPTLIHTEG